MSDPVLDDTLANILNGNEKQIEAIRRLLKSSVEVRRDRPDLLFGAQAIADELGLDRRQAYYLLQSGHIPGARHIGGTWCVKREGLVDRILAAGKEPKGASENAQ